MSKVAAYINEDDGLVCAKCFKPFTEMLTDEEIENIAENCWKTDEDLQFFDYNKFAKAILRKAQEK